MPERAERQTRLLSRYVVDLSAAKIPSEALRASSTSKLTSSELNPSTQEYFLRSQREILQTAKRAKERADPQQKQTAIVFGAGPGGDIPLKALATMFDALTLVDIRADKTVKTIALLPPNLQQKITIVEADVTGVVASTLNSMQWNKRQTSTDASFINKMTQELPTIEVKNKAPDLGKHTFVCSSLVASQLYDLPYAYMQKLNETKHHYPFTYRTNVSTTVRELQREHLRYLARSTAESGLIHFADTYAAHEQTPTGEKNFPMIEPGVNSVLNTIFNREERPSSNWQYSDTRRYTIRSFVLDPHRSK